MHRRGFITGLGALFISAPAIVRASSLMPVKMMVEAELYGRSPAMDVLPLMREWQAHWHEVAGFILPKRMVEANYGIDYCTDRNPRNPQAQGKAQCQSLQAT